MAEVVFDHVTRIYPGNDKPSVDDLNLDIKDGEFLVLVGPSGCGKSTTLRMLAGLEEVNKGRILIGGKDVTTMQPKDRDIAMVFQNYALYPHMTVADNMGFALKIAGTPKDEIRKETNREIVEAVNTGRLDEAVLDAAVERLLTLIFDTDAALKAGEHKFDEESHHMALNPRQTPTQNRRILTLKHTDHQCQYPKMQLS